MRALGAGFTIPEGGLNIWLTLPEDIEAIDLFYDCLQRNVSILLGRTFCVDDSGPQAIRLSFGMSDKAAILSAIDVIEDAIRLQRASTDPQFPVLV